MTDLLPGSGEYGLVRDSFPSGLARNSREVTTFEDMAARQVTPTSRDALFDWAKVIASATRDPTRKHELVYKSHKADFRQGGDASRVSLRLFGVLGTHTFAPYGNWSG